MIQGVENQIFIKWSSFGSILIPVIAGRFENVGDLEAGLVGRCLLVTVIAGRWENVGNLKAGRPPPAWHVLPLHQRQGGQVVGLVGRNLTRSVWTAS